jgi:hypothetical protein
LSTFEWHLDERPLWDPSGEIKMTDLRAEAAIPVERADHRCFIGKNQRSTEAPRTSFRFEQRGAAFIF